MAAVLFLLLYGLLFLAIGSWISLEALKRRWFPKEFLYISVLAASLAIYYAIFYLYLIKPSFANIVVKIVLLLSLLALVSLVNTLWKSKELFSLVKKFFMVPLVLTGIVLFAYLTIFYSCMTMPPLLAGHNELDNRTFCNTSTLPFDNSLPFIFGQDILRNQEKVPAATWNMVDRPPLAIAATLPILGQDAQSHSSQFTTYYSYHIFSVFLELSWVGAFWGIFQMLKMNKKFQLLALTTLATLGFFYINSVFVWPKLLAASLVFTGILSLLGKNKPARYRYLPFAALTISLGALSHTAVLFTVIPFLAYYLFVVFRLKKINVRYFGVAFTIALVMLAPWFIYKNSVVKTDRLAKWQFAGVTSADDKRGTAQTIKDQYKTLTFGKWINNKEENVKTVVTGNYNSTPGCSFNEQGLIDKCVFGDWRTLTFFSSFFAFEALNLGWLAVIYQFIRKKIDLLDKELLIIITGSLLFWVLLVFAPGGTILHTGSYTTMMLIALLLLKKISELPKANLLISCLAGLQITIFYLAWVTIYFRPV